MQARLATPKNKAESDAIFKGDTHLYGELLSPANCTVYPRPWHTRWAQAPPMTHAHQYQSQLQTGAGFSFAVSIGLPSPRSPRLRRGPQNPMHLDHMRHRLTLPSGFRVKDPNVQRLPSSYRRVRGLRFHPSARPRCQGIVIGRSALDSS